MDHERLTRPWHGDNTQDYCGTYDEKKVRVAGWEYSTSGEDVNFTIEMPTHAVAWMRPKFARVECNIPEGFAIVDAHDCWPEGAITVRDESGKVIVRPSKGTMVLAPLPKDL